MEDVFVRLLTPEFIAGVGFPIAVCYYLLKRVLVAVDALTSNIGENNKLLALLLDRVGVANK